jgi:hypothetical protein
MKKLKIDPEDILKDINKAFSLLEKIENVEDFEDLDIDKLDKEINQLKNKLEKKYPDNLDSKK